MTLQLEVLLAVKLVLAWGHFALFLVTLVLVLLRFQPVVFVPVISAEVQELVWVLIVPVLGKLLKI